MIEQINNSSLSIKSILANDILEFAKEITSKTIDSNEEKVKIALSSTMGAIINYNSKGML